MAIFAVALAVLALLVWTARISYREGTKEQSDSYTMAVNAAHQARILSDMLDQAVDSLAACTVRRNETSQ